MHSSISTKPTGLHSATHGKSHLDSVHSFVEDIKLLFLLPHHVKVTG